MSTREKLVAILFAANENNRSYYLSTTAKSLFSRCMRLFFVYQRMDTYETLMLHDYGFYKFEKFKNYTEHRNEGHPYLQPLFASRDQNITYDESSQMITACMKYYELKLKNKDYQGKLASKIVKFLLLQFGLTLGKDKESTLKDLLSRLQSHQPKNSEFIKKYSSENALLTIISFIFNMLERGKKYLLSSIALCMLILNS